MTSDQLIAWLERKLAEIGVQKVIPHRVVEDASKYHVPALRVERFRYPQLTATRQNVLQQRVILPIDDHPFDENPFKVYILM